MIKPTHLAEIMNLISHLSAKSVSGNSADSADVKYDERNQ